MFDSGRLGPLEWAAAGRPLAGQDVSGDQWVMAGAGEQALICVVDGLGHGDDAASAARRATGVVVEDPTEPLEALFVLCHQRLAQTRGCAMTLVRIGLDDGVLSWLGVGNVGATLVHRDAGGSVSRQNAMLRGGIVGQQLPGPLNARTTMMLPGDLLLIATDGLGGDFDADPDLSKPAGELAAQLLERRASDGDDALIVAVRNRGPSR